MDAGITYTARVNAHLEHLAALSTYEVVSFVTHVELFFAYRARVAAAAAIYNIFAGALSALRDVTKGSLEDVELRANAIELLQQIGCGHTREDLDRMTLDELMEVRKQVLQSSADSYRQYVCAINNMRICIASSSQVPKSGNPVAIAFHICAWTFFGTVICYFVLSPVFNDFLGKTKSMGSALFEVAAMEPEKPFDLKPYCDFTHKHINADGITELQKAARSLVDRIQNDAISVKPSDHNAQNAFPVLAPAVDATPDEWAAFYDTCGCKFARREDIFTKAEDIPPLTECTANAIAQQLIDVPSRHYDYNGFKCMMCRILCLPSMDSEQMRHPTEDVRARVTGFIIACGAAATAVGDESVHHRLRGICDDLFFACNLSGLIPGHYIERRYKENHQELKFSQFRCSRFSPKVHHDMGGEASTQQEAIEQYPRYAFMQYVDDFDAYTRAIEDNFSVYAQDSEALHLISSCFHEHHGMHDRASSWMRGFVKRRMRHWEAVPNSNSLHQVCSALELLLVCGAESNSDIELPWDGLPNDLDEQISGWPRDASGRMGIMEQRLLLVWGVVKFRFGKPLTALERESLAVISIDPCNGIFPHMYNLPAQVDIPNQPVASVGCDIAADYRKNGLFHPDVFFCIPCVRNPFDNISKDRFEAFGLQIPPGVEIDWRNGVLLGRDGRTLKPSGENPEILMYFVNRFRGSQFSYCQEDFFGEKAFETRGTEVLVDGIVSIDMISGIARHRDAGEFVDLHMPRLSRKLVAFRKKNDAGKEVVRFFSLYNLNDEIFRMEDGELRSATNPEWTIAPCFADTSKKIGAALDIDMPPEAMVAFDEEGNVMEIIPTWQECVHATSDGNVRCGIPRFVRSETGEMEGRVDGAKKSWCLTCNEALNRSLPAERIPGKGLLICAGGRVLVSNDDCGGWDVDDILEGRRRFGREMGEWLSLSKDHDGAVQFDGRIWDHNTHWKIQNLCKIDFYNREKAMRQLRTVTSFCEISVEDHWTRNYPSSNEELPEVEALLNCFLHFRQMDDMESAILSAKAVVALCAITNFCHVNICNIIGDDIQKDDIIKERNAFFLEKKDLLCEILSLANASRRCLLDVTCLRVCESSINRVHPGIFKHFRGSEYLYGADKEALSRELDMPSKVSKVAKPMHLLFYKPPQLSWRKSFSSVVYKMDAHGNAIGEFVEVGEELFNFAESGVAAVARIAPWDGHRVDNDHQTPDSGDGTDDNLGSGKTAQAVAALRRRKRDETAQYADIRFGSFLNASGLKMDDVAPDKFQTLSEAEKDNLRQKLEDAKKSIADSRQKIRDHIEATRAAIEESFQILTNEGRQKCFLGKYKPLSVYKLVNCALKSFNHRGQCFSVNGFVAACENECGIQYSASDAKRVLCALESYMCGKTALDEVARRENAFENLHTYMLQNFIEADGGSALELREKFGAFVQAVSCVRAYDPATEQFFLLFEFLSGLRMRQEQVIILRKMYSAMRTKDVIAFVYEMMMGAGKTSVVNVMLAEILASLGSIPIFVNHQSLQKTMTRDLIKYTMDRYGKDVIEIQLTPATLSASRLILGILEKLERASLDGSFVSMTNTDARLIWVQLRKLEATYADRVRNSPAGAGLKKHSVIRYFDDGVETIEFRGPNGERLTNDKAESLAYELETQDLNEAIKSLRILSDYIKTNCAIINDEAHANLDPTFSLNIPFGGKEGFTDLQRRTLTSIFSVIHANSALFEIVAGGLGFEPEHLRTITIGVFAAMGIDATDPDYDTCLQYILFDENNPPDDAEQFRAQWDNIRERLATSNPELLERLALLRGELGVLRFASRNALNGNYGFRMDDCRHTNAPRIGSDNSSKSKTMTWKLGDRIPRVVPYVAANTPSTGEYAHPLERVTYTMFAHMLVPVPENGNDPGPFATEINLFIQYVLGHPKSGAAMHLAKKFGKGVWDELVTNSVDMGKRDAVFREIFDRTRRLLMDPEERTECTIWIVDNNVKTYPGMIEGTAFLQGNISGFNFGCSGTLWNCDAFAHPFRTGEKHLDESILPRVASKAIEDVQSGSASIRQLRPGGDQLGKLLTEVTENHCAFIDVAGVLKDYSGLAVVRGLQKFHTDKGITRYEAYAFYAPAGEVGEEEGWYLLLASGEIKFLPNNSPDTIALIAGGCTREGLFVYFDQSHCVGVDFQLPRQGKATITMHPDKTNLHAALQGILRMRGFFTTQSVDILICSSDRTFNGICELFDRLSDNEQAILNMHRMHNYRMELMEAAQRIMEEKAARFFRIFRFFIEHCHTWFGFRWFYQHYLWLLQGCAELAITKAPFNPVAWYGPLAVSVDAAHHIGKQRCSIAEILRPFGEDVQFLRRTAQMFSCMCEAVSGTCVRAICYEGHEKDSKQVATQTEIQVQAETEAAMELEMTVPKRNRGEFRKETGIRHATRENPFAWQLFAMKGAVEFQPGPEDTQTGDIIKAAVTPQTTREMLQERVPSYKMPGAITCMQRQLTDDVFNELFRAAMLAHMPLSIFEKNLCNFAKKLNAIYSTAELRKEEQNPAEKHITLPLFADSYSEHVNRTFAHETVHKIYKCIRKFEHEFDELCAGTNKYKKQRKEGQRFVNMPTLVDLLKDDLYREILKDEISNDDSEHDILEKVLFPVVRIFAENGKNVKLDTLFDVLVVVFKEEIGESEKQAIMALVDTVCENFISEYCSGAKTICLVLKALFNLLLPPQPDNAPGNLAKLALIATNGAFYTDSQEVATLCNMIFGSQFSPGNQYNVENALRLITCNGLLSEARLQMLPIKAVRDSVEALLKETQRQIVKLGGKTFDTLKIYDGEHVKNAIAGIRSVNSWLQEYWPELPGVFPQTFFASDNFTHAFTGDNDPVSMDARHAQYILICRDSRGEFQRIFVTPQEAKDFGKLIESGDLVDAHIYTAHGDRVPYRWPCEPEENPETDPDWGGTLKQANEQAKEAVLFVQLFNGTLTPEVFQRNPKLIPRYNSLMRGHGGFISVVEKCAEKTRQDTSWMSFPVQISKKCRRRRGVGGAKKDAAA
ncbi:MAG: hypothetical protein LBI34_01680 [Puniceicoccales bacterium]|jgi:hypothetical protein|nr:hypothetical protein [Puniceicoccales bacterium]